MKKITYIFFAISLLLFSCKAMDYSYYREGDDFVCLQYYNLKKEPIEVATQLHKFYLLKITPFEIDNDTLKLYYFNEEFFKYTTLTMTEQVFFNGLNSSRDRNLMQKASPNSFYQVVFPMLEIEGVEKKDMAKWYKSFYAIKAVIKTQTREFVCYYYNPRSFLSASNYTRP